MSVGKRPGSKFYWMSFVFNGQKIQKSTKCTNKREAEAVEAAFRTQLAKKEVGIEPKKKIPTFKEAITEFINWCQIQHAQKPNTIIGYNASCKSLLEYFDHSAQLDSISSQDVEKFKMWRKSQPDKRKTKTPKSKVKGGLAGASVNRQIACLKVIFNYFIKNGFITKNPASGIKLLPENLTRWKVISEDTERRYLLAASDPLQSIATLMLETGCRPEELFRLERKNVNLFEKWIFIPFGKTRSARRRIPLSDRAFGVLAHQMRECVNEYIFINERTGKPITDVKKAHASAIKRSGIEYFRLYDLRHTFASRMAMAGVDLVTLKDLLGHSALDMVLRYAHANEEHRTLAIKKLERARLKKAGNF
ncbi:MAG TPA: site-specific integrase [Pyrinomonadaceae bacterium]